MSQLKPCPFCGSKELTQEDGNIQCCECGTVGPLRVNLRPTDDWNTRDTSDLRAAQIRALEWAQQTMREHNMNLFKFKHRIAELEEGGALI